MIDFWDVIRIVVIAIYVIIVGVLCFIMFGLIGLYRRHGPEIAREYTKYWKSYYKRE